MYITKPLTKKNFDSIIYNSFLKEGIKKASLLVDILKSTGFYFGTSGGFSIGMNDLNTPEFKKKLILDLNELILIYKQNIKKGISSIDLLETTILTKWNLITNRVKSLLANYFKERDPYNDIYVMATSGARGNTNQMNQLLGLRGLMSDAEGNTIKIPIINNFKEGLFALDYFISAFGARKGIVDTALKTADSGYLTRRLVYLAQNIQIKTFNCNTLKSILVSTSKENSYSLIGSICVSIPGMDLKTPILISTSFLHYLRKKNIKKISIRSPKICNLKNGICQLCYGLNPSTQNLVNLGETVGVLAAQSIGEPGTQLTMRTFHTGGVSNQNLKEKGVYKFIYSGIYKKTKKRKQFLFNENGKEYSKKRININSQFILKNKTIEVEKKKENFNEFDIIPVFSQENNKLFFYKEKNKIIKLYLKAIKEQKNILILEHLNKFKKQKKLIKRDRIFKLFNNTQISGNFSYLYILTPYKLKEKSIFLIKNNYLIKKGKPFLALPVIKKQTNDIVQGLPKVESLLEIRNQDLLYRKYVNSFSFFEHYFTFNTYKKFDDQIYYYNLFLSNIFKLNKLKKEDFSKLWLSYLIKYQKNFSYTNLFEYILYILKTYLICSIQNIYFSQGVTLYIKHLEIIINEIFTYCSIIHEGETLLYNNDIINIKLLLQLISILKKANKILPIYTPEVYSLTKSGLKKPGFLANAGFQETKKILTAAALFNKKDWYTSMKDSLILGKKLSLATTLIQKQNQLDFVYYYKNKI